jgi:hypothetical protein
VAVPVKNEQDCIKSCLEALDGQVAGHADHIVLLLNNCYDATAEIARSLAPQLLSALHIIEVVLTPEKANAGVARHMALAAAEKLAGQNGVLLTTDADSRVDPNWIGANLGALDAGADAVAGWAELDPVDWGSIPLALHEADARECAYDAVCDEIHALLDPDPDDPLPRHTQASGASIAVSAKMYRAAGGMPKVPTGEDRAFITALRKIDARVRHSPECRVVVSGRLEGRAAGGMAATIRRRMTAPDEFLDARLEPAQDCARRAVLRRLARLTYNGSNNMGTCQQLFDSATLWQILGISVCVPRALMDAPTFGAAWSEIEKESPLLTTRRVPVRDLSRQQSIAEDIREVARRDPQDCIRQLLKISLTVDECNFGGPHIPPDTLQPGAGACR